MCNVLLTPPRGRRHRYAVSRGEGPSGEGNRDRRPKNKKTPPLAAKRNGGAGTEKRPSIDTLIIPSFAVLSIDLGQEFLLF